MPHDRLDTILSGEVDGLRAAGTGKGQESVITEVIPSDLGRGPRFRLAGSDQEFLRMNSNGYLGLALHPAVIAAEEAATGEFGVGPGAVRFISGTYRPHVDLEARLASFHGRQRAMIFSSAYAAVVSALTSLITTETVVFSDALNHNCIINGLKMARPAARDVYPHLDFEELDQQLGRGRDRDPGPGGHRWRVLDAG